MTGWCDVGSASASISLERPWSLHRKNISLYLVILEKYLLWSPTWEWRLLLPKLHVRLMPAASYSGCCSTECAFHWQLALIWTFLILDSPIAPASISQDCWLAPPSSEHPCIMTSNLWQAFLEWRWEHTRALLLFLSKRYWDHISWKRQVLNEGLTEFLPPAEIYWIAFRLTWLDGTPFGRWSKGMF